MFRIILCDDNREQVNSTLTLLENYHGVPVSVRVFYKGEDALNNIDECDLYLLDILMPGLDGISLARLLRERDADTPIIFLTSSVDFALDAFQVSAFQYLLKPVSMDALYNSLDRLLAAQNRDDAYIMIQTRDQIRRISFASIVFVELSGRNLLFSLSDGEKLLSRTVRVSFASAVGPLLNDSRFLYAHKSYLLNMEKVNALTPRSFVMSNGAELPIPRHKYTEAKNRYLDYLSSHGIGMVK